MKKIGELIQKNTGSLLFGFSALLLLISVLLGYSSAGEYSRKIMGAAISACTAGYAVQIYVAKQYSHRTAKQMLFCHMVFLIWILPTLWRDYQKTGLVHMTRVLPLLVVGWMTGIVFWCMQFAQGELKAEIRRQLSYCVQYLKSKRGIGLLLVVTVTTLLSIDTLHVIPMWDDEAYVRRFLQMPAWNYTFDGITSYSPYGHLAPTISIFMLFGRELIPQAPLLGMRLVQVVLSILAVCCIYQLLRRLYPQIKWQEQLLITGVIAAFPSILGMQYINLDYFFFLFFVFFFYCYERKWYVLQLVCGMLLCFSKEPAVITYAGFCVGVYLIHFIRSKGSFLKRMFTCMTFREYVLYGLPPVLWFLIFQLPEKIAAFIGYLFPAEMGVVAELLSEQSSAWDVSNGKANTFCIDLKYIGTILLQTFSLNFMWLLVLAVIVAAVIVAGRNKIVKRMKTRSEEQTQLMTAILPLLCSFLVSLLFLCFYVTYNLYRYKTLICFLLILTGCMAIKGLVAKEKVRVWIFSMIGALFMIQSYICIDPVTMLIGNTFDTGRAKLVSVDKWDDLYISNNIVINRQGYDWMPFMQEILRKIEYNEHTLVLTPLMKEPSSAPSIWGVHYLTKTLLWNEEEQTMTTVAGENNGYPVIKMGLNAEGEISAMEDEADLTRSYDRAYVIHFPFFEDFDIEAAVDRGGWKIMNQTQARYRTWSAQILELEKK